MKKLKDRLLDLLFTPNGSCPICGKVLFGKEDFLCGRCQRELPTVALTHCEKCGRPVANSHLCQNCIKAGEKAPDGGCVWLDYSETAQRLISEMKFHHRQGLCVYAGRELAKIAARQSWIDEIDVLVPVPLHPQRLKERGYNQSLLIAEGLSEKLAQERGKSFSVETLLVRVIDTPHQVGKGRSDRLRNLDGAFETGNPEKIQNKNILLVDDVLTTGTTTRVCIDTLRLGGAAKVFTAVCAGVADFSRA